MKKLLFLIALLITNLVISQKTPTLNVGKRQLALSSLDIKATITGNIATTTYDMLFYNPSSRVLEGELKFPLGENQEISRLALEIQGKLREAVVVEKELGRVAFEGIVRKGVDPALLEKGKGNSYNVRVYPIPANGYKRVVIAYEQELVYKDEAHYYHLPLSFKDELDFFNVSIETSQQKFTPLLIKGDKTMSFSKWENVFRTILKKEKYIPNKSVLVKMPIALKEEKLVASSNHFYFYKTIKPEEKKRERPNKISIYWDASLSMKSRNTSKEINLLHQYFRILKNVDVDFLPFSNLINGKEKFKIRNGDWSRLKKRIMSTVYDGGTSYSSLKNMKDNSDVIILFSDGITTQSKSDLAKGIPVFVINSKTKAAHKKLHRIAKNTNGGYLNLNRTSIKEALSILNNIQLQYLGYNSFTKNIEVYRSESSKGLFDFSIAGKNYKQGEKITFFFGYGDKVTQEISVVLKKNVSNDKGIIRRIWAKNKINYLLENKEENKESIINTAVEHSLVTEYTSLIVLEDVQDYITYNIPPPKELLDQYNMIKNNSTKRSMNRSNMGNSSLLPERIEIVEDTKDVEEMIIEVTETDEAEVVALDEIVEVEEEEVVVEDVPFSIVEKLPIYLGCEENLRKEDQKKCFIDKLDEHIKINLNTSLTQGLEIRSNTRILAKFTIDKRGEIINIQVRSQYLILANEVVRVLKMLPRFIPASQRGRSVNVSYILPITMSKSNNPERINLQRPESVIVKANTIELPNNARNRRPNSNSLTESQVVNNSLVKPSYKKYKGSLQVEKRIVNTPYLNALDFFKDKETAYLFYIKQRESYKEVPHYYIDVSDYFNRRFNARIYASRILSNVSELDADNYELLKAYAYKLEERNENTLALFIYKTILELRPEDAQSYRDVALAYQNIGLCQEAFDVLLSIVNNKIYEKNKHRRVFKGMQDIAKQELNILYKKYKDDLDISKAPEGFFEEMTPIDFRTVVDWNHNDTDIDLHVIDPNLEECYYSHTKTEQGGSISRDMTQGFGPECFTLKEAEKGLYYVKIKYFGDRKQKIETPTFMKITIYKNQGKKDESKQVKVVRLTKKDKEEMIAKVKI
ncbi:VIT domain-containing protein [Tenacibaculum halocynthiae]|uniref:VIT domain-containing protein n=1 Tax=Tenacibaculum halocynthiae TaxID=1254437 RepID=UPI0038932F75